jgi:hypothetical protein
MKLKILILLLFFIIFQSKADQIYELIKIPNLKIYQIDKETNLRYLTPKKDFITNSGINNVSCKKSNNYRVEKKYIKTKNELNVFKKKFFEKIKLRYIILCEELKVGEINALGFANPEMEIILLNINAKDDDFERVIHHEVFHIIENNYKKFFPDTVWAKFNNQNFYYSGSSINPETYSLAKVSNTNGFFSEYAKYSISEDMAETFSFINSREKYVSEIINLDRILNKKVIFIKEGMSNIKKSF